MVVFPLKTATSAEVLGILLNSMFQIFNIKKVLTDNGPCFREKSMLETLSALSVEMIPTSALNPKSKGLIEHKVKTIKNALKKALVSSENNQWLGLPLIIAKQLNSSYSSRTSHCPYEVVFGSLIAENNPVLRDLPIGKPHTLVQNSTMQIESKNKFFNKCIEEIRHFIAEKVSKEHAYKNKGKIKSTFEIGSIVFVKDNSYVPGVQIALKSRYHHSPYEVLNTYFTTTLVKRIADGFIALYSNDLLKQFNPLDPLFSTLPVEILKLLKIPYERWNIADLSLIQKMDPLDLPDAQILFDPENPENYSYNFDAISQPSDTIIPETAQQSQDRDGNYNMKKRKIKNTNKISQTVTKEDNIHNHALIPNVENASSDEEDIDTPKLKSVTFATDNLTDEITNET